MFHVPCSVYFMLLDHSFQYLSFDLTTSFNSFIIVLAHISTNIDRTLPGPLLMNWGSATRYLSCAYRSSSSSTPAPSLRGADQPTRGTTPRLSSQSNSRAGDQTVRLMNWVPGALTYAIRSAEKIGRLKDRIHQVGGLTDRPPW